MGPSLTGLVLPPLLLLFLLEGLLPHSRLCSSPSGAWAKPVHSAQEAREAGVERELGAGGAKTKPPGCWRRHKAKVVDVGGYLNWALGLNGVWKQPKIYVGDRLRFTWPAPSGGEDARELSIGSEPTHAWHGNPKGPGRHLRSTLHHAATSGSSSARGGATTQLLEHNVYQLQSERAFKTCNFDSATFLADVNFTTQPLTANGTYFYACEEDNHCYLGQKVKIIVKPAPLYDRCVSPPPPPPPPSNEVTVGVSPTFWTLFMTSWKPPAVSSSTVIVFKWDSNSVGVYHDVQQLFSKTKYTNCDLSGAKVWHKVSPKGIFKYNVTEAAGTKLYFVCGYSFHCAAGMLVAFNVV